jgi:hypothetical protein
MKQLGILILLAMGVLALACGHSNLAPTIFTNTNGNWEAQLIGGKGPAAELNFVTSFTVQNFNGGTGTPLIISGFSFINDQTCLPGASPSGSMNLTTQTTNEVTGSMEFLVKSLTSGGATLSLFTVNTSTNPPTTVGGVTGIATGTNNLTLTNGIAYGDWQLTSSNPDCVGNGTFVMCQNAATCTVP